jgi:hypothetical protein
VVLRAVKKKSSVLRKIYIKRVGRLFEIDDGDESDGEHECLAHYSRRALGADARTEKRIQTLSVCGFQCVGEWIANAIPSNTAKMILTSNARRAIADVDHNSTKIRDSQSRAARFVTVASTATAADRFREVTPRSGDDATWTSHDGR